MIDARRAKELTDKKIVRLLVGVAGMLAIMVGIAIAMDYSVSKEKE